MEYGRLGNFLDSIQLFRAQVNELHLQQHHICWESIGILAALYDLPVSISSVKQWKGTTRSFQTNDAEEQRRNVDGKENNLAGGSRLKSSTKSPAKSSRRRKPLVDSQVVNQSSQLDTSSPICTRIADVRDIDEDVALQEQQRRNEGLGHLVKAHNRGHERPVHSEEGSKIGNGVNKSTILAASENEEPIHSVEGKRRTSTSGSHIIVAGEAGDLREAEESLPHLEKPRESSASIGGRLSQVKTEALDLDAPRLTRSRARILQNAGANVTIARGEPPQKKRRGRKQNVDLPAAIEEDEIAGKTQTTIVQTALELQDRPERPSKKPPAGKKRSNRASAESGIVVEEQHVKVVRNGPTKTTGTAEEDEGVDRAQGRPSKKSKTSLESTRLNFSSLVERNAFELEKVENVSANAHASVEERNRREGSATKRARGNFSATVLPLSAEIDGIVGMFETVGIDQNEGMHSTAAADQRGNTLHPFKERNGRKSPHATMITPSSQRRITRASSRSPAETNGEVGKHELISEEQVVKIGNGPTEITRIAKEEEDKAERRPSKKSTASVGSTRLESGWQAEAKAFELDKLENPSGNAHASVEEHNGRELSVTKRLREPNGNASITVLPPSVELDGIVGHVKTVGVNQNEGMLPTAAADQLGNTLHLLKERNGMGTPQGNLITSSSQKGNAGELRMNCSPAMTTKFDLATSDHVKPLRADRELVLDCTDLPSECQVSAEDPLQSLLKQGAYRGSRRTTLLLSPALKIKFVEREADDIVLDLPELKGEHRSCISELVAEEQMEVQNPPQPFRESDPRRFLHLLAEIDANSSVTTKGVAYSAREHSFALELDIKESKMDATGAGSAKLELPAVREVSEWIAETKDGTQLLEVNFSPCDRDGEVVCLEEFRSSSGTSLQFPDAATVSENSILPGQPPQIHIKHRNSGGTPIRRERPLTEPVTTAAELHTEELLGERSDGVRSERIAETKDGIPLPEVNISPCVRDGVVIFVGEFHSSSGTSLQFPDAVIVPENSILPGQPPQTHITYRDSGGTPMRRERPLTEPVTTAAELHKEELLGERSDGVRSERIAETNDGIPLPEVNISPCVRDGVVVFVGEFHSSSERALQFADAVIVPENSILPGQPPQTHITYRDNAGTPMRRERPLTEPVTTTAELHKEELLGERSDEVRSERIAETTGGIPLLEVNISPRDRDGVVVFVGEFHSSSGTELQFPYSVAASESSILPGQPPQTHFTQRNSAGTPIRSERPLTELVTITAELHTEELVGKESEGVRSERIAGITDGIPLLEVNISPRGKDGGVVYVGEFHSSFGTALQFADSVTVSESSILPGQPPQIHTTHRSSAGTPIRETPLTELVITTAELHTEELVGGESDGVRRKERLNLLPAAAEVHEEQLVDVQADAVVPCSQLKVNEGQHLFETSAVRDSQGGRNSHTSDVSHRDHRSEGEVKVVIPLAVDVSPSVDQVGRKETTESLENRQMNVSSVIPSVQVASSNIVNAQKPFSNLIAGMKSFVPVVQQPTPSFIPDGKRVVKVKALIAAEAAKRAEEEKRDGKESLRKMMRRAEDNPSLGIERKEAPEASIPLKDSVEGSKFDGGESSCGSQLSPRKHVLLSSSRNLCSAEAKSKQATNLEIEKKVKKNIADLKRMEEERKRKLLASRQLKEQLVQKKMEERQEILKQKKVAEQEDKAQRLQASEEAEREKRAMEEKFKSKQCTPRPRENVQVDELKVRGVGKGVLQTAQARPGQTPGKMRSNLLGAGTLSLRSAVRVPVVSKDKQTAAMVATAMQTKGRHPSSSSSSSKLLSMNAELTRLPSWNAESARLPSLNAEPARLSSLNVQCTAKSGPQISTHAFSLGNRPADVQQGRIGDSVPCSGTPCSRAVEKEEDLGPTSYDISPYKGSSDDESEDETRPAKHIPSWARKENLEPHLLKQVTLDPDEIFSGWKTCSLKEVFGKTGSKKIEDFGKRSGSGDWFRDRVSWKEELQYKIEMGYVQHTNP